MQRLIWAGVLAMACVAQIPEVSAREREQLPVIMATPSAGEGIGCYWERGRQFCSRYCYVEVDGRRYCTERARDAHSQAPADELPAMILSPMK